MIPQLLKPDIQGTDAIRLQIVDIQLILAIAIENADRPERDDPHAVFGLKPQPAIPACKHHRPYAAGFVL
ncbi:hypothetical protein GCM10025858_03450 [Alicyclobacillus sacchari]|nr:hypothetical protein GCM10025858_03450 [Alicyclobacillus sacchari]